MEGEEERDEERQGRGKEKEIKGLERREEFQDLCFIFLKCSSLAVELD